MTGTGDKAQHRLPQWAKTALDFGPLASFFIANWFGGIFIATGVLMVAIAIAATITWMAEGRIAPMLIVTLVFVLIFGGLTIWLENETFIKVKVSLVNALFGSILVGGWLMGKPLVKVVMGEFFKLDDTGWKRLSLRWGIFFFSLAGLNEFVWRSFSTDTWVNFKVFGLLVLTMAFGMAQMPLIHRHMIADEAE